MIKFESLLIFRSKIKAARNKFAAEFEAEAAAVPKDSLLFAGRCTLNLVIR